MDRLRTSRETSVANRLARTAESNTQSGNKKQNGTNAAVQDYMSRIKSKVDLERHVADVEVEMNGEIARALGRTEDVLQYWLKVLGDIEDRYVGRSVSLLALLERYTTLVMLDKFCDFSAKKHLEVLQPKK
jgi:hypothetical protein